MEQQNSQKEIVYVKSPSNTNNQSVSAMAEMLNAIMPILMMGMIKDVLKH